MIQLFFKRFSGLMDNLHQYVPGLCVYADGGYPLAENLLAPFRGVARTAEQLQWNRQMSSIRISVEWGFAQVMRLWAHLDFRNQMKVLRVPTSKMYIH